MLNNVSNDIAFVLMDPEQYSNIRTIENVTKEALYLIRIFSLKQNRNYEGMGCILCVLILR